MEVGIWCEDSILNWFASKKNFQIVRNQARVHENGIMACSLDAIVKGDPTQLIEAKTTGIVSRYIGEEWGAFETDEVPERIALQCQHQMAVMSESKKVWVPVLMGGVGFQYYVVERNDELIADLTEVEVNFWKNHIEANVPPDDVPLSLNTAKKLRRVPNKTISIADGIIAEWLSAKEQLKAAEAIKLEKERLLFAALGDAECATSEIGTLTYYLRERKCYTVEPSAYRQLTFSKPKGASHGTKATTQGAASRTG